jgi:hypothetical protein
MHWVPSENNISKPESRAYEDTENGVHAPHPNLPWWSTMLLSDIL